MKSVLFAALIATGFATAAMAQTEPAPATAPAAKFNLDTPIEQIVADAAAKAALDAAVPGISTHESYEMFKGMSLNQVAPYSGGKLTPEVLAGAEKALAAVK